MKPRKTFLIFFSLLSKKLYLLYVIIAHFVSLKKQMKHHVER